MPVLVWQYAGPRASGIADHYATHLRQFAVREGLGPTDVTVAKEARAATVSMSVSETHAEAVAKALRPHQILGDEPG